LQALFTAILYVRDCLPTSAPYRAGSTLEHGRLVVVDIEKDSEELGAVKIEAPTGFHREPLSVSTRKAVFCIMGKPAAKPQKPPSP
jgi:hypothetical protein